MTKEQYIHIELPIPPSVNGLFTGMQRRRKSDDYKDWILLVDDVFRKMMNKYAINGNERLEVHYNYFFSLYNKGNKEIKKKDVFNYEKALSDVLEKHIEGFRDEKIKKGIVEKHDSNANIVKILIKEIKG